MGHEKVVLEWFPVEAERLAAPAALRARLARLAGLAVPPTGPRRLEEPEHLGFALALHRADQGVSTRIDRGRAGEIRAVEGARVGSFILLQLSCQELMRYLGRLWSAGDEGPPWATGLAKRAASAYKTRFRASVL